MEQFGESWEIIRRPVEAIVGAVDFGRYNGEIYRVGLSPKQMCNLNIRLKNPNPIPRNISAKNEICLSELQAYGQIIIESNHRRLAVKVYNAIGPKELEGDRIRVSSILADELGIIREEKVILYSENYSAAS